MIRITACTVWAKITGHICFKKEKKTNQPVLSSLNPIHIADDIACSTWKCQFALSFTLLFPGMQLTMVTCADAPVGHLEACYLSYVSVAISVQHDILPYRDQI